MSSNKNFGSVSAALLVIITVVLLVAPGAWAQNHYTSLYTFTGGADGKFPAAGLVFDSAGNLYGTTEFGGLVSDCSGNGCGVVFELSPQQGGGWSEKVLYSFTGGADGGNPSAGVIFDQAGNLYGTAQFGGPGIGGTVFKLTPNSNGTWTESLVYGFCAHGKSCRDGNQPSAGLIFDGTGNLYGTTQYGGNPSCTSFGCGVVFKLTPSPDGSWTENVIHYFNGVNVSDALSGLILDPQGNLYSTTASSGKGSWGTVFELVPNADEAWKHKVLHNFPLDDSGGALPLASVVFDSAGNLYGTTEFGGTGDCGGGPCGVVFELIPNADGTWQRKVLHRFTGGRDGAWPQAALTVDASGNLYSTTTYGGNLHDCVSSVISGCGVVFKLTPNSNGGWSETVLHTFTDQAGDSHPYDSVIFDSAGNLYGTTTGDSPYTHGSVFEVTP
jgi:uncharacterized repeat protein (TIGR03803 family)